MQYEVFGPFYAPVRQGEATGDSLADFWEVVEAMHPGLPRAVGVYVFSTSHGSSYTPWYVGKTNAKAGFRGEIFQGHKLDHYISARERKRGIPRMHLIAKVEPARGNFCRPSARSGREIDELETVMIAMALRSNPDVRNSKKTWFNKTCQVPGIMGEPPLGRPSEAIVTLRNTFRL